MRITCSLLVAALAILAPIHAVPVDQPPVAGADPDYKSLGFEPLDGPSQIPAGGPSEYPPTVGRKFKRYVALGDSYSAGPGASTHRIRDPPGPPKPYFTECYRSDGGWPVQLKNALDDKLDFQFSACTGWDSKTIREAEVLDPNSNFDGPDNKWPDLVSITMGGNNDNAFITVIRACTLNDPSQVTCDTALKNAQTTIDNIEKEFTDTMNAIMDKPRDGWRTLVVMGYPALYNEDLLTAINCGPSQPHRKAINTLVNNVNGVLQRIAAATHATYSKKPPNKGGGDVVFADPNTAWKDVKGVADIPAELKFDGHRFCENLNTAYLNGGNAPPLTLGNLDTWLDDWKYGLFHPDANGMRVMAQAAQIALSGLSADVPTGDGSQGSGPGSGPGSPPPDAANPSNGTTNATVDSISCSPATLDDFDQGTEDDLHESDIGNEARRDLEKRGNPQKLTFMPVQGGPEFYVNAPSYAVAKKTVGPAHGYYYPKSPLACGRREVAIDFARGPPAGFSWVTEHVFEKQCLRNYLQYMAWGTLPSGGRLEQGAVDPSIFQENTGLFFRNWPAGGPRASWGDNPEQSAFGVLGHSLGRAADMGNLRVLDKDTNGVKALVSGYKNFVGDDRWKNINGTDPDQIKKKVWIIQQGALVNAYMLQQGVIDAYNHAYQHLLEFWHIFAQLEGAGRYDYEAAFTAIVRDDLNHQIHLHGDRFADRIHNVTTTIGPNPTGDNATYVQVLGDLLTNQAQLIRYNIDAMMAPGDDTGDPMAIDPQDEAPPVPADADGNQ